MNQIAMNRMTQEQVETVVINNTYLFELCCLHFYIYILLIYSLLAGEKGVMK